MLLAEHDRLLATLARKIPEDLRAGLAAEDVCQDAYIVAIQNIGGFQPRGDDGFGRWLRAVAMRVLLQEIRARRALKRGGRRSRIVASAEASDRDVVNLLELLAIHERTPSRSAAVREAVVAVQRGIEGLNDDHRQAIRLRYIKQAPVKQVAGIMNRSEAAVTMLCQRGLAKLRDAIGDASRFFSDA